MVQGVSEVEFPYTTNQFNFTYNALQWKIQNENHKSNL